MTDKERILTLISARTAFATTVGRGGTEDGIHWEMISEDTKLNKSDIVCGITNPAHEYGVAFFEERHSSSDFVVRDISTNKKCNYGNEMFMVLRNFPDMWKLCGKEHIIMQKVKKAFYNIYSWVFVRVDFTPKNLTITMRKKWTDDKTTFVFNYECPISRITLKSIISAVEKET